MNADPAARPEGPILLATAGLSGLASVAVELAVVRLLGPYFGQSELVWANAVGGVLLALALGAWVGGRLADRAASATALAWALVPAALWLVAASRVGPSLGAWLAPVDLSGDRPLPLSFWGSLVSTIALSGPPVLLTGIVGPVCVRRLAARHGAGRAAGLVSVAATVGGLLACLVVPSVAIPAVGSKSVVAASALLLALPALALTLFQGPVPARAPKAGALSKAAPSSRDRFALRPGRATLVLLAAFLVGGVVTGLEFAGFRALAPSFGQTSAVYATGIGVVIASLAAGYGVGGAIAGRARFPGRVAAAFLAAACVAAWLASRAATWSALGLVPHAGLRIGVPTLLLGAVSPLLVRILSSEATVGRAAGAVFAVGTLGSLAGCYAAPLLSLPSLGTAATFSLGAASCAVAALLVALAARGTAGSTPAAAADAVAGFAAGTDPEEAAPRGGARALAIAAAGVAVLASAIAVALPRTPLRADAGLVEERETAYQTVRIVERMTAVPRPGPTPFGSLDPRDFDQVLVRYAGFDEDLGSYQSVRFPKGTVGTGGRYYDHLAIGAWFEGMPWTREGPAAPRVLIVGYGGGTLHRLLKDTAPEGAEPEVTGVEIDPEVVSLARAHLGLADLEDRHLRLLSGEDGRTVLASHARSVEAPFDLVVVDAYQRTQYVPFHLVTLEFFEACARALAPTGAVGVNVNAPSGLSGRLLRSIASTMRAALDAEGGGAVWIVPNPQFPESATVWGTKSGAPPRLPPKVPHALEVPAFAVDRLLVRHDPERDGGEVFTDDRAPVDRWTDEALVRVGGGP